MRFPMTMAHAQKKPGFGRPSMPKRPSIIDEDGFDDEDSDELEGSETDQGLTFFALWVVWLLVGTIFYAYAPRSNLGIVKGYYMSINVGYSIGFGYPEELDRNYMFFSSVYVLIGSSFVAVALGFFADKISTDQDNWFTNMMQKKEYQQVFRESTSIKAMAKAAFDMHAPLIRGVCLWLFMLFFLLFFSLYKVGWSFQEALYFAISTLSTGGLLRIPDDSPNWLFGLMGFMAMLGVPITAMAMAQIATACMGTSDLDTTKALINADVTGDELKMLHELGLEDGDGEIDRAEFIILCMVRMGTDPTLIDFISKRFKDLDQDGGGTLSIGEITGGRFEYLNGSIRLSRKQGQGGRMTAIRMKSTRSLMSDLSDGSAAGRLDDDDEGLRAMEGGGRTRVSRLWSDRGSGVPDHGGELTRAIKRWSDRPESAFKPKTSSIHKSNTLLDSKSAHTRLSEPPLSRISETNDPSSEFLQKDGVPEHIFEFGEESEETLSQEDEALLPHIQPVEPIKPIKPSENLRPESPASELSYQQDQETIPSLDHSPTSIEKPLSSPTFDCNITNSHEKTSEVEEASNIQGSPVDEMPNPGNLTHNERESASPTHIPDSNVSTEDLENQVPQQKLQKSDLCRHEMLHPPTVVTTHNEQPKNLMPSTKEHEHQAVQEQPHIQRLPAHEMGLTGNESNAHPSTPVRYRNASTEEKECQVLQEQESTVLSSNRTNMEATPAHASAYEQTQENSDETKSGDKQAKLEPIPPSSIQNAPVPFPARQWHSLFGNKKVSDCDSMQGPQYHDQPSCKPIQPVIEHELDIGDDGDQNSVDLWFV